MESGYNRYIFGYKYQQLHYYRKDNIYDKDGNTVNFDWQKYEAAADKIGLLRGKQAIDLYDKALKRDNFKHIPNGVYYCHIEELLIPFLLFQNDTIHQICGVCESDIKNDEYDYFYALSVADKHMYSDVVNQYTVAMYNNYHYGVGLNTASARKNLEHNLFSKYRDLILTVAASPRQQKAK